MKKLIFLAFLAIPLQSFSQSSRPEIPTAEDSRAIVSQIKDVEVTSMISETAEFRECRELYQFEATATPDQRTAKLREAETCFKEKLGNNSSPERLKQLSDALNLQTYKLVKSNSSKEIQEYLTNKMIEALTGVDPSKKDAQNLKENLKFGKKKIVDQSVFIELYRTQLGKNALFEISRFCFENLRSAKPDASGDNIVAHWSNNTEFNQFNPQDPDTMTAVLREIKDDGKPTFGSFSDTTDKSKIYEEIFRSIQGTGGSAQNVQAFVESYFLKCGALIAPLCNKFKEESVPTGTTSNLEIGLRQQSTAQSGTSTSTTGNNVGAAACLSLKRISEYKTAIANTEKVAEYFEKEMQGGGNLAQFMVGLDGQPIQIYGNGSDSREPTIDALTNNTSSSFLQGNLSDQIAQDRIAECSETPELANCEGIVYKSEDLDKIKQKIELEQTLKREVEMERVRKLVDGDRQDLETYLKENGFFDILKDPNWANDKNKLVESVGKHFEARKLAMINEINSRLGSRQAKDDNELKNNPQIINEVNQDTKEERARLAQVVMFNNIIISHLTLQRRDGDNVIPVGRNTGAWSKEQQALTNSDVNEELFKNLKASDGEEGGGGGIGNSQIADFSILDDILGKPSEQPAN